MTSAEELDVVLATDLGRPKPSDYACSIVWHDIRSVRRVFIGSQDVVTELYEVVGWS
jgi:hypothetical protein